MSIPEEKLRNIKNLCKEWLTKTVVTKRELQSLLGSLLYVSKCIKIARIFLSRMLDTLRRHHTRGKIDLDTDFKRDLVWFYKFSIQFNGVAFFDKRSVQATVELDASLTGMGAVWGNMVYAVPLVKTFSMFSIVHWEMFNILIALKVWGHMWKNKKIHIKCDNQAVVSILNTCKSTDKYLRAIARNILFLCAMNDIHLITTHILGKTNIIADILSRWFENSHAAEILHSVLPESIWVKVENCDLNIDWYI